MASRSFYSLAFSGMQKTWRALYHNTNILIDCPTQQKAALTSGFLQILWCYFSICSNLSRTRGARGNFGLMRTLDVARLVRSLRSREQKPKIFLTFLIFLGGGCGGSRQKMERKFLVLLRRFRLQNEHFHYIICGSLTLFISPSLRRYEALPLGVLW